MTSTDSTNRIVDLPDLEKLLFRVFVIVVIVILSGIFLYRYAIVSVCLGVIHRDGSSHGIFVPFLSLFFIWIRRDALKKIKPEYNFWGLFLIGSGFFPFIIGSSSFQLYFIGFILFVAGFVLTLLGWRVFRHIAFPMFFLITMMPLPKDIYDMLANCSRYIALGGALKILSFFGIPYVRDGWVVHLPNVVLRVAIACSGIRYMVSFFVFGLAYAWLYKRTFKERLLIVTLTIPLSYIASIMRLTAIFILAYTVSPYLSEHGPHVVISWIIFGIFLFGAIAIDQHIDSKRNAQKEIVKRIH